MPLPTTMRFIDLPAPGDAGALRPATGPLPRPAPGEVLLRVEAAGVNRPDVEQRRGNYPPPPGASPVLGLEVAGEVVALGEGVEALKPGDRVCALANGGGYAEYCAVPAVQCLPWPAGYDAVRAAALPETYFTVWANLFQIGRLSAGEKLLVHGGTSGIGVTAIKLARAFGATVYATAGSEEKCAACRSFGAEAAINYRDSDFAEEVARLTGKRGVDVVLDMVGADYLAGNLRSLAPGGRLVIIGFMGGRFADRVDLARIVTRRLTVTGSTMRPRGAAEKGGIARELREKVWPLLERGECGPEIYRVLPLEAAAEAHRLMEGSGHIGKIMLRAGQG
ncbi:NAD(P)H-quinone oxidoreductase [Roseomonas marmotae]|uniref:NAD(P)H-quinone oxidoreductase n=1 Tax=Roseomonas marmotae TaxID=2768161 RepID=A0ABS3KB30_9PROT|nr:NAD(P)H-quinone oxidoreductase [Roseomonas marmotae]MBO1074662.1 NAD(P)H-quinone oxidoreductase [Roseomonas marmotae]QTI81681.1 NAD(P)H-quinone oxidoreductase [Roseomonas marmotae]